MDWGSVTPSPRGTPEHPALDNFSAADAAKSSSGGGGSLSANLIKDYLPETFPGTTGGNNSGSGFPEPESGLDNRQCDNNLIGGQ